MKVAVPCDENLTIAGHFGRCASFLVFETAGGNVAQDEIRPNRHSAHAHGGCHGEPGSGQPHSHAGILRALHDCQAVICRGMGWRAAEDLKVHGIEVYLVHDEDDPENAVRRFLAGELSGQPQQFCRGQH